MFSMKRLLVSGAHLSKLNLYPTARFELQAPIQFQQCCFATSVTSPKSKSGSKKPKSKKTTKPKPKAKPKQAKKAKKVKKVVKPKPFMQTLSKRDKKLLKRFPDPQKPDRPLSGYTSFVSRQFENNVGMTIPECAKLWKQLGESEKMEYKNEVLPESEQYKADVKKYKLQRDESVKAWLEIMKNLKDERPPRSGYIGFVQENKHVFKEQVGRAVIGEGIKVLASQWKQLGDNDRQSYNSKYSGLYQEWKDKVDAQYN